MKQNPLKTLDQKREYWEMKYKKLKTDLETAKRCIRFTNKDTCQNEACTNKICPVRNRWVMKECKRHDWRIGAWKGGIKNGKIVKLGKWIWCYKCGKKILAKNTPKIKLKESSK